MSVIFVYKNKDAVYMGCDRQTTCGESRTWTNTDMTHKVTIYKDILFGACGNARIACLVASHLDWVSDLKKFDKEHLYKEYFPKLAELLKDNDLVNMKNGAVSFTSEFVLAKGNRIFYISQKGVKEVSKCVLLGSGTPYAAPFFCKMNDSINVEERMKEALRAITKHHIYVSGNMLLTDTKSLKLKEVAL